MLRIRLLLTALVDIFKFAKRAESRRDSDRVERMLERKHQLDLLEKFMTRIIDLTAKQNESIIALAQAQSAQADAFSLWLKSFQAPAGESLPPSSVIREEDEWLAEQKKLAGFPADLPPEFQLVAALQRMNNDALGDFDREGSDF